MRQVPFTHYLVIGDGRMARHFCHYLSLLNLPFHTWNRRQHDEFSLQQALLRASHVVVLIKDSAIESFVARWQRPERLQIWVHFSGQKIIPEVFGCHPLMTFAHQLYDLATYQSVPFILTDHSVLFSDLLPHLPNQAQVISADLKTFYHALCVISGNFTCLVWQKFFHELTETFQIPHTIAIPYFKQIMQNILTDPTNCLTGPLVRGDKPTIDAHLQALQNDDFSPIYQAVLHYFKERETA
ncbi:DUF2520 domain-containing protein [Candidatus Berkiella aquae]|uniref:DUF2520 domain-containing protein n=1 Tax=Candidatus Berkiella aquae TaxID=295108 RepID=A0A0Q9YK81_9GAMM|nr:DUF2520 domain-containing protein [Candidatus Berkiella aquae]MCS5711231.1 DUF2520 domain-containing protein [Candidatus Berkiella aquae]